MTFGSFGNSQNPLKSGNFDIGCQDRRVSSRTMGKMQNFSVIGSLGPFRKKLSHLRKKLENLTLKRPRPKLFVNKNAIKSNFGNCTNKVGNFQIGTERLREFGHLAWEFLRFGSSHTALLC